MNREIDKEKIYKGFYDLMVRLDINMLTLQSDSLGVTDDYSKIYNKNLDKYLDLTPSEIKSLKNLKHIYFEEFNNYYFHRISEIEKAEIDRKEAEKDKKRQDFEKMYEDFYNEEE